MKKARACGQLGCGAGLTVYLFVLLALWYPGSLRAEQAVDLELVIGVDVSGSVDDEEAKLQRDGYIAAFTDSAVIDAIRSGYLGRIAVIYFEWAGWGYQKIIVDWSVIDSAASAKAFAAALTVEPPETASRTSISEAVDWGVGAFERNSFRARRRVIDISGDGANNYGRLVTFARDDAVNAGITINGLPIINTGLSASGRIPVPNLDLYFEHCVIGGRGAFTVVAHGFKDFAKSVRRKLVLEIAGRQPEGYARRPYPPIRHTKAATAKAGFRHLRIPGSPLKKLVRYWRPEGPVQGRFVPPCDAGEQRRMERIEDWN